MSNLPDSSGGGIFHPSGGGWDLNNAQALLVQMAERMDTQWRAHHALQQEVIGLRHELRDLDKNLSTTKHGQGELRGSVGRLGERIGSVEAAIASLKSELELSRRILEDSGYSLRSLTEKLTALDERDNQQARELRAMREWQVQAIAVGGFVVLLLSIFGPKFLTALVDNGR